MKIYLIQGNNNEVYDQYYEWIEGIYLSKENDKKKLYDEDYLKSKIKVEYTFDSQYYKSIRNNLFKSEVE